MRFRRLLAVFTSGFVLAAISAGAQVTVNLAYDGDGNLVAKTVNGITTQYLIDDINPTGLPQVIEESVNGVVQRRYTYGLQRISETQLINGAWVTSYYGYDAQGNVRQLTDAAGVVTDTYDYDAYGNLVNHTGTTPNVYLYRGERYDPDMGMYYMRARWYNPATGRFMSRDMEEGDPPDPASLHKYLYAGGDPVNKMDPTGHEASEETAGTLGNISLGTATVHVLGVTALAIECAYLSNATKSQAEVEAGITHGYVKLVAPCVWKAKCPPCDPPPDKGTRCYQPDLHASGSLHYGMLQHYHLWVRNQDPKTCQCYWNIINGPKGTVGTPPPDQNDCNSYPSWFAN